MNRTRSRDDRQLRHDRHRRIADNQLAPAVAEAEGAPPLERLFAGPRAGRGLCRPARRHFARAAHDDLDALLADPELDAVIIASPDKIHAAQGIAAARAGKHVFAEKPMVTDRADGRALVDACRDADVKLGVAFHMRWHAGHRALAEAAHSGSFGTIRHMRILWTQRQPDASNWRASPEIGRWWSLGGVGPHCVDQVCWFMQPEAGEVRTLRSVIDNSVWNSPRDETAGPRPSLRERGDGGDLHLGAVRLAEAHGGLWRGGLGDRRGDVRLRRDGRIWTDRGEFDFPVHNPYVGEVRDFVLAVEENRKPEVDGEEGLHNVDLLLRAVGA